jgi:hypothetical protein
MPLPDRTVNMAEIGAIVARLAATDLQPSPVVNTLFQALVAAAYAAPDNYPECMDPHALTPLHQLCARGEANLEAYWARLVAAAPDTVAAFPYLDNYQQLIKAEYAAIVDALGRPPRTLVFAGSGPLPLSAVLLARLAPGLRITCLDSDRRALRQGRRMARALAGTEGQGALRFVRSDAATYDYTGYDAVVVAALVGLTPSDKTTVLTRVAGTLAPGSLLAARSVPADGRRLLYPRIEPHAVPATLTVLGESTPPPGIINSLLFMRQGGESAPRHLRQGILPDSDRNRTPKGG